MLLPIHMVENIGMAGTSVLKLGINNFFFFDIFALFQPCLWYCL